MIIETDSVPNSRHSWNLLSAESTMIVSRLTPDDVTEPEWDAVGIRGCDFRPHFAGDLINVFTTLRPSGSKTETATRLRNVALEIGQWIVAHRPQFSPGDRFQIIVGWPRDVRGTDRQVIKTGGSFDEIQELINDPELIQPREGWDIGVFPTYLADE